VRPDLVRLVVGTAARQAERLAGQGVTQSCAEGGTATEGGLAVRGASTSRPPGQRSRNRWASKNRDGCICRLVGQADRTFGDIFVVVAAAWFKCGWKVEFCRLAFGLSRMHFCFAQCQGTTWEPGAHLTGVAGPISRKKRGRGVAPVWRLRLDYKVHRTSWQFAAVFDMMSSSRGLCLTASALF